MMEKRWVLMLSRFQTHFKEVEVSVMLHLLMVTFSSSVDGIWIDLCAVFDSKSKESSSFHPICFVDRYFIKMMSK